MRTHPLLAISITSALLSISIGAGCGGAVDETQDNGESRAAAATEGDCPHVAPQQGTACAPEATRCAYPVQSCSHDYQCKCTADRGWICEMPAECVSR
jgi:hypothetical protein